MSDRGGAGTVSIPESNPRWLGMCALHLYVTQIVYGGFSESTNRSEVSFYLNEKDGAAGLFSTYVPVVESLSLIFVLMLCSRLFTSMNLLSPAALAKAACLVNALTSSVEPC